MRLATVREILARYDAKEMRLWTGRSPNAIAQWKARGRIPERSLFRIALANPWELIVDDEGHPYWLEASNYEPPDWMPPYWWDTYVHARQRHNLGVADDQLQEAVDALAQIREEGGDVAAALRHAATRKLRIPIAVRKTP